MLKGMAAVSARLTLEEVVARLSRHAGVDGVLVIGSVSKGQLTPASDYDLVVVLAEMPAALDPCGVTSIDGRLTDLLFVSVAQLEALLALEEEIAGTAWLGRIARWFEAGEVRFDREGRLGRVQASVRMMPRVRPPHVAPRGPWRGVNYNLAQSKRLLRSEDPVYRAAAELRCALFGTADLLFSYFDLRHLPWEGEKAAVRHLMAHDAGYLERLLAFTREDDLARKFALYEELAALTLAPVGEVWAEEVTVLALKDEAAPDAAVLGLWDTLMGE
jgi:predicted nucleotidyltransferase